MSNKFKTMFNGELNDITPSLRRLLNRNENSGVNVFDEIIIGIMINGNGSGYQEIDTVNALKSNLYGLTVKHSAFSNINIENSTLYKCVFSDCVLKDVNMSKTNAERVSFKGEFCDVDFSSSMLQGILFVDSVFERCDFSNCNLSQSRFVNCSINNCNFSGSLLSDSDFSESIISECNFDNTTILGIAPNFNSLKSSTFLNSVMDRGFVLFFGERCMIDQKTRNDVLNTLSLFSFGSVDLDSFRGSRIEAE